MNTETNRFADAHDSSDALFVRMDEDGELEVTIAYGDKSSIRTVFLTAERIAELAALLAEFVPAEEPTEQTHTEFHAERADAWVAARGLISANGLAFDATVEDHLELAKFLAGDDIA
ncbi:hypothetical protein CPT_Shady_039 [Streptomyces phage Shady]|uniref:Uncharacterized protein n=1 Tax=Streptomyces phage Shady TaxID=2767585 RepID=A0A873WEF4_9CAUD|nr:hypothetical protein CPT_Shady_039 [Streptomyces phage Shady]